MRVQRGLEGRLDCQKSPTPPPPPGGSIGLLKKSKVQHPHLLEGLLEISNRSSSRGGGVYVQGAGVFKVTFVLRLFLRIFGRPAAPARPLCSAFAEALAEPFLLYEFTLRSVHRAQRSQRLSQRRAPQRSESPQSCSQNTTCIVKRGTCANRSLDRKTRANAAHATS